MKSALKKLIKNNIEKKTDSNKIKSPLTKYIIAASTSIGFFFVIIIVVITIVLSPIMLAQQYIDDLKNNISLFFEKIGNVLTFQGWCADSDGSCQKKSQQKYYEQLDKTYNKYKDKGVEIDVQLITGTIFYGDTLNDDSFEESDSITDKIEDIVGEKKQLSDVNTLASKMVSGNKLDYTQYKNYLLDTYIEKRFKDMYNSDEGKQRIAEEIMSYASLDGKGSGEPGGSSNIYEDCKEVCTTNGQCYSLEEFVTRVVDHESGIFNTLTNNYAEEWKAQAVAARTYVLNTSNSCTTPIELGINIDIMDPNSSDSKHDIIEQTIKETEGEILTINNQVAIGTWDSFYKGDNYHCDEEFCYATYTKVGTTWGQGEKQEVKSYKRWSNLYAGGHGMGFSQYAAGYLSDIGWNYKDIVKYFYDDNVEISTLTTVSTGVISGGKYTSNAPIYTDSSWLNNVNFNYYAPVSVIGQNYGECPWYAKGRAIELIANSNMPDDIKQKAIDSLRNTLGNGADWYRNPSNELFSKSTDLYAAKPGSIVSWSGGGGAGYGHVGIIEDVEYDSDGKAKRVLLTDGWNGTGNPSNAQYAYRWMDIETLKIYSTRRTYYFNGYVYLLD